MKRILFVAISATLLAAGCQKTEIINRVGDSIGFSTNMGKLTKAEGTNNLNTLKAQDFSVWAYYAADDPHTEEDDELKEYGEIGNVVVSDGEDGKWSTQEQYYWPGVGKELIFFAVSADKNTIGTKTQTKVSVADNRTSLTVTDFEVAPETPTVDLMVADIVQQHQGDKVVDLNFHHTLAKVEFQFNTISNEDNLKVTVNSLEVAEIKTKGTFSTVDPNATKADGETAGDDQNSGSTPVTPAYSGAQTEIGFYWTALDIPKPFSVKAADASANFELTDEYQTYSSWLVIPQSISSTKVTVNYTIGEKDFVSIFDLFTDKLTAWAPNQYIKYRITLAPNLITFNPTVEDWEDAVNVDAIN